MIDLTDISGLPLALETETGLLSDLAGTLFWEGPGERRFGDLQSVMATPDAVAPITGETAYLTYRDVRQASETGLAERGLRYDVTVTLPGSVAGEFAKTAGHYHGLDPRGVGWPEIYDVLFGSAVFVLQLADGDPSGDPEVSRGLAIVASPGDRLIIPPGYGHVTVNTGVTPLVVADLVATASTNHYQSYATRRGGAVRIMTNPTGAFDAVWNPAYPALDQGIETIAVQRLEPFAPGIPLYRLGTELPETVTFLTDPQRCPSSF